LATPSAPRGLHYGWIVAAASVTVVIGALGFARFGYTMILPSMQDGLGIGAVGAADLATGNMLGYLVFSLLGGVLASRFGSRAVIFSSMLAIGLSMAATGLSPGYGGALVMRTITGMASGGANVPVMALVATWFAARYRGLAVGITVSGSSFGLLITGLLVPSLLGRYGPQGWRACWLVLGALAVVIAALGYLLLRNHPSDRGLSPLGAAGQREMVAGAGASGSGAYGARGSGSGARAAEASGGGAGPLNWALVYRSGRVWHLASIYVLFGFSYIIYATFFARFLTAEGGLTIERAGRLWSGVGVASIGSGLLWGTVSDRLGRKWALAMVFTVQGSSYFLLGLWRSSAGFLASGLLFSLAAWSIPAIMAATARDLVGARLSPAAFGFVSLFFSVGQAAGPFAGGRIAEALGSYAPAFVLAGAAAAAGVAASLLLPRPQGDGDAS
jgi:predicted MFS family arabinose efflux permease